MRKKFSVTIDESILEAFRKAAEEDCINMSAWIESKIKEYVERRKLNENLR